MGEMLEKSVWIKLSSRLSGILWSSPPRISAHSIWTTLLSLRWPGNGMGGQPSRRTVGPVEVQSDVRAVRYSDYRNHQNLVGSWSQDRAVGRMLG